MTIGSWNGHVFEISIYKLYAFSDLSLKGACQTEDKTKNNEKYVSYKNGNAREISLTVILHEMFGVDVKAEALSLTEAATKGEKGYFYIGDGKLVTPKLMLVSAEASEIEMIGSTWESCKVKLTLKQCETSGGSSSSSSSSSSRRRRRGGGTVRDVQNSVNNAVHPLKTDYKQRSRQNGAGGVTRLNMYK